MYGAEPHHSYCYGGSGGGLRSQHSIERAGDVYDGCVPFMTAHTHLMSDFPVALNALRVLRSKLPGVIDATQVGGSGNPFEGLDTTEREALAELYRSGFARGAEMSLEEEVIAAGFLHPQLMAGDPSYFDDFWSVPGYAGYDDPAVTAAVYEDKTTIREVLLAGALASSPTVAPRAVRAARMATPETPLGVVVANDLGNFDEGTIEMLSGEAAGQEACVRAMGDMLVVSTGPGGDLTWLADVSEGDEVLVSNRKYLAQCFWPRYHLSGELRYRPSHQWAIDGRQMYPQRPPVEFMNVGPEYTYEFTGKQILIQNAHDTSCWPAGGAVYHEMLRATFGDRVNEHFRLWWNDHASHMPAVFWQFMAGGKPHLSSRLIDYLGSVQQAVFDLIAWVEDGIEPPATSGYDWSGDWKLSLAAGAAARAGIQPVVTATANGSNRAEVKAGEPVQFAATADVPPGTGTVISVEWDFEGEGEWALKDDAIDGTAASVDVSASHTFKTPGTYFPAVRVTSHRQGDVNATLCRVPNLGRVRVVVR
jgi:hypothetical protein